MKQLRTPLLAFLFLSIWFLLGGLQPPRTLRQKLLCLLMKLMLFNSIVFHSIISLHKMPNVCVKIFVRSKKNYNKMRLSWDKLSQNWDWGWRLRWVGKIEDKVQLSPAEAEIGAELGMTDNHSKQLVGSTFCHRILTLLFLGCSTTILGWVGEIENKVHLSPAEAEIGA